MQSRFWVCEWLIGNYVEHLTALGIKESAEGGPCAGSGAFPLKFPPVANRERSRSFTARLENIGDDTILGPCAARHDGHGERDCDNRFFT